MMGKRNGVLAGKIISKGNINKNTTFKMIGGGWNLMTNEDLEIDEVEQNAFSFVFRREEGQIKILRGRPWFVQGRIIDFISTHQS